MRRRLEKRVAEERIRRRGAELAAANARGVFRGLDEDFDPDDLPEGELEELEEELVDEASAAGTIAELEYEIATLGDLEDLARQLRDSGADRKWEELSKLLQNSQEMFDSHGGSASRRASREMPEVSAILFDISGSASVFIAVGPLCRIDHRTRCRWKNRMAHRYRLCPDEAQEAVLLEHCAHARFVWNLAVEQRSWWWPGRGSAPSPAARMRQLAEARAAEPWLARGSSSVQQQALRDFDRAMAAFFDPQNPAGQPSYRSRRGTQGFVIRDVKARRLNRNHAEVFVPKYGYVRFRLSRDLPADPGMARVTCDRSGRWHVAFPGPQPTIGRQPTGAVAGIDRGVRTALVTSDGQHYRVPRISDRRAARYLALQRRMSRQQKGSRKREKTRRAMAAITVKVTDRRKDWRRRSPPGSSGITT